MKREARNHSKTKRLCRKLDIPLYQAMGILECIWHLTATEAWRGDIGKLSNEDIALALDYRGSEDILVGALVYCGWLDANSEHRLLVHDWPEHADSAVQKRAERAEKSGQIGFYRSISRQNETNGHVVIPHAHAGPDPEPVPEPVVNTPPTAHATPPKLVELAKAVGESLKVLSEPATVDHFEGMELQIANDLFREFRIPSDHSLTRIAGQALVFECERLGSAEMAVEAMRVAMKEARARGDTVNRFWFQDKRYDTSMKGAKDGHTEQQGANGGGKRSPTKDRIVGNLEALFAATLRKGTGETGGDHEGDGGAVSQPRPERFDDGLDGGLRSSVGEILRPARGGGTDGAEAKP